MNAYFLVQLQCYTVLMTKSWIPFRVRKMLYQGSEGSSTPGKPVSPWRKVNVLAIYSESDHEYRLSNPTAVVHNADWLDLNTFSPVKDALSRTRRLLNTWKKMFFSVKAIQCSGHVTGSYHEYTLSEPTAVTYSADWLHQNTSPPTEYAVPRTTRLFKT